MRDRCAEDMGNIIVVFMGMDGSGKSTLSRFLFNGLKKSGINASYTWWLEGEYSTLRNLMRKIQGNRIRSVANAPDTDKKAYPNLGHSIFGRVYTGLVLIDYLRFGFLKSTLPKKICINKVLIFDRYYYDVIFALSNEFRFTKEKKHGLLDVFNTWVPKPDIIFMIDVPPEIPYQRKKEELISLEKASRIWERQQELHAYLEGLSLNLRIVHIDNTQSLENAKETIMREFLQIYKHEE